ncbi:MAG: radical SAM protein [Pseudomonadota bacterium]
MFEIEQDTFQTHTGRDQSFAALETAMKPSQFNVWTQLGDGVHLLYNTRSNALLRLSAELKRKAESYLARPGATDSDDLARQLVTLGFMIDDATDELALLKTAERTQRFDGRRLGLTICTTLACNLRCVYCYQKKDSALMSQDVQSKIVDYVDSRTPGLAALSVVYFGGEPLVGLPVIESLAQKFQGLAAARGFNYSAAAITNGYLLTEDTAKQLSACGVRSVQVTLDGPQRIHDQRRPQRNGKGSYDRILENLQRVVGRMEAVSLRVNIDKGNADAVPELLTDLDAAGLRGKVNVYFGLVDNATESCRDYGCNCFSKEQFASELPKLQLTALRHGFVVDNYPGGGMGCGATSASAYVVAPDGRLFKCYNHTGVDGSEVGHISGELDQIRLSRWLAYDPFDYPKCKACDKLPLCLGSCPASAVETGEPECPSIAFGLHDTLKMELLNRRFREMQRLSNEARTP